MLADVDGDDIRVEIFRKYKYALAFLGIDFFREDVRAVILDCVWDMESAFQATIVYWKTGKMEYPNAFLIHALNAGWKPRNWRDEYLDDPNFKSPCLRWWEGAGVAWGTEVRDRLIADVNETDDSYEYVLFANGKTLSLRVVRAWGWERVLNYALGERRSR